MKLNDLIPEFLKLPPTKTSDINTINKEVTRKNNNNTTNSTESDNTTNSTESDNTTNSTESDNTTESTESVDYNFRYGMIARNRYIVYLVIAVASYLIYHACLSCTLSRCLDSQDTLYIKSLKNEIIRDYLKKKYSSIGPSEIELITAKVLNTNSSDQIQKIRFEQSERNLNPTDVKKILSESLFNRDSIKTLKTLLTNNYMIVNDSFLILATDKIIYSKENENELNNIVLTVYLKSIDSNDLKFFLDEESKYEKEKLKEYFKNKNNLLSETELINLVDKISIMKNNLRDVRYNVNFFDSIRFNNKYLEIIFWSLFGVFTFLIYTVAQNLRNNTFDPHEFASYSARAWYTPFVTIVVLLLLNRVIAACAIDNTKTVSYGFENAELLFLIAFSFVSGFYSKRTLELLNRIKDAVLPEGKPDDISYYKLTGEITLPVFATGTPSIIASQIKVILKNIGISKQLNFVYATVLGNQIVYSIEKLEKGTYELSSEYIDKNYNLKSKFNYKIDLNSGNPIYTQNIELITA